jgi:hypothetical protein
MNVGMMWFDGDNRNSLVTRIDRAASYYQEKYGRQPTVCFVNPTTAGEEPPSMEGLRLQTSASVLPDHFWLGVGQEPD